MIYTYFFVQPIIPIKLINLQIDRLKLEVVSIIGLDKQNLLA